MLLRNQDKISVVRIDIWLKQNRAAVINLVVLLSERLVD